MESSIFSAALVKGLTDKIYDKRKSAALEIERLVKENAKAPDRIKQIVNELVQDFVYSKNPNARYGGLIGLAATAIALGPAIAQYLDIIVPPILSCFNNQDQKVRYYACESMYNIAKVAKGEVLRFFNSIFDALCKLSADSELTVKNGAELLDRLIKDIVAELSTTYVSPHQVPLNPAEEDQEDEEDGEALEIPSSLPRNTAFSLPRFIPLLRKRIYVLNSSSRNYLVSWISALDSIPDLELVSFLPEFLDGLIRCLSDPSKDIRVGVSALLTDFLVEIQQASTVREQQQQSDYRRTLEANRKKRQEEQRLKQKQKQESLRLEKQQQNASMSEKGDEEGKESKKEGDEEEHPATTPPVDNDDNDDDDDNEATDVESDGHGKGSYVPGQGVIVKYGKIIEILLPHLSSEEEDIQRTALQWINEFIVIAKDIVIRYTPKIIKAVLPSLAHPVSVIRVYALETNQNLQKLVLETAVSYPEPSASMSDPSGSPHSMAAADLDDFSHSNGNNLSILRRNNRLDFGYGLHNISGDPFDYQATVSNLCLQFLNEHEETRVASLEWLLMLHKKAPSKILPSDDGIFPALLKTLSDSSEEVVRRDLQLLAQISFHSDHEYFRSFMVNLLLLFSTDRRLLESRGSLIIRQLCMSLDPERIYCTIADILENDEDLEFASIMIQQLNIILITSSELSDLRKRLRNLDSKDNQRLFITLYKSWCHNAVATFSLCLLAQAYEHAAIMLQVFAEMDITVSMLVQVDKLVQLLESPVFTYLRLQLLEPEKHPYLYKCLYGILMLLPQSSAFSTLRNRLSSVSSLGFLHGMSKNPSTVSAEAPKRQNIKASSSASSKQSEDPVIKYQELLQHFKNVQARHERQRRQALQSISNANAFRSRKLRSGLASGSSSIAPTGNSHQNNGREDITMGFRRISIGGSGGSNGTLSGPNIARPSTSTGRPTPTTSTASRMMSNRKGRKP
ncbi:vacuolar protein 14 C-terminal Fig4p binding-domain-containing protein [Phycomyces nitens]|nr:vacuolar protein 14 C-terminal Fig4p binding-domain-containing protein [Phycomyces nitens]